MSSIGTLSRNVTQIAALDDLPGAGQVTVVDGYAYIGHIDPPFGTSIIDVRDPRNPKVISTIMLDDNQSHTHKVRVVGDIMITNVEQDNRHFLRLGDRLPELRAQLGAGADDAQLAAELTVKTEDIPILDAARERGYADGGFKVYDISNKRKPELLSYVRTHGFGVHRFDLDADYAYISTEMDGYIGNILVNYDISNPAAPSEVSRWWMPGQHLAGGETPTWRGYRNRLHHAMRHKDRLYAAVWHGGFRILDVSDITKPTVIGSHNYHPPIPEPTHTMLPMPFPVDGREIAIVVDEEHGTVQGKGHANLWVFDISDLDNIQALSRFDLGEGSSPYWDKGWFGAHQFQEHFEDTLVCCTWFTGGLRIIDVADPLNLTEAGFYIPEPRPGFAAPLSNDVDVDENGLIYLADRGAGLDILELKR